MSFAEEFGHNIPPDDWDGGYSRYRPKRGYSFVNYKRIETLSFIEVVFETDKAYLIRFEQGKAWVPISQIDDIDVTKLKLKIPYWLKHSLEYFND